MKLVLKIATGTLLTGTCLFGFSNTMMRVKAAKEFVSQQINEASSSEHLLSVARQQLAAVEDRLLDAESVLDEHGKQEKRLWAELCQVRGYEEATKARLTALRPALAAGTEYFSVGCRYAKTDVEADAAELTAFLTRCAETASVKEDALKRCRSVLAETRTSLNAARGDFATASSRVEALSLRLRQEEAPRANVSGELQGDLARTLDTLEKRASKLARKNATRPGDAPLTRIPADKTTDGAALLRRVDAALGTPAATAVPSTTAAGH